jgi:arylsulfatase A-like enzyme
LADIQPTVLECLGMEARAESDGRSLARLCLSPGGANEDEPRLIHSALHKGEIRGEESLLSVRTTKHKYIRTSSHFEGPRLVPQSDELYDLSADPGETLNLAAEEPELLRSFRALADPYWDEWLTPDNEQPAPLSDESREILRSLGYM